jgi:hypothetical protein
MDKWKLINVENIEWEQDKSGYYSIINPLPDGNVRLDILTSTHSPAWSWQGEASDVRKCFARYSEQNGWSLSAEHIAYIGYELARAEILGKDYIQD